MRNPHVIRLNGPWRCEPLAFGEIGATDRAVEPSRSQPPPGTIQFPADWNAAIGPHFHGRVRFSRHFNRPTGLDAGTVVYLVIEGIGPADLVQLNGRVLDWDSSTANTPRFDITLLLSPRNELAIDAKFPRRETTFTSRVRVQLEIE